MSKFQATLYCIVIHVGIHINKPVGDFSKNLAAMSPLGHNFCKDKGKLLEGEDTSQVTI